MRQMGPWNSYGTFGYSSVLIVAIEKAAVTFQNPDLVVALSRLKCKQEKTKPFIELLEAFGPRIGRECHRRLRDDPGLAGWL